MKVSLRKYQDIYVIDLDGELDLYNTTELLTAFRSMEKKEIRKYVINLERVSYIDSSGIGALIQIHATSKSSGYSFWICGIHGTVERVFALTKLENFFCSTETPENAIRKILAEQRGPA